MIQNVLQQKLRPLIEAERTLRRRKTVAWILFFGALALAVLLAAAVYFQFWSWTALLVVFAVVSIATLSGVWWADTRSVGVKALAERIEESHPDLRAALLTAVEQEPNKDGKLGYLQERVVYDAVNHALEHDWIRRVSRGRLAGAFWFQALAAIAFGTLLWFVLGEAGPVGPVGREREVVAETAEPEPPKPVPLDYEIQVLPGDTEVERGERLIIEAKFGELLPPEAMLVMRDPGEEGAERGRVPMKSGLDEAVFSGLISKVDSDLIYRIEFDGLASDEFSIATFVHPELEKADAEITPPEYAQQETKKIEDVRKVSLLEGSDLAWSMKVNKPVADAELFGEDESVIKLTPSADDPTLLVASHQPEETLKYRLHLIDEKDRANKRPPWFTVTVKRNLPPKLDFTFPKRDVEVSAIEELPVEAKIWDDLGILKTGATFTYGDEERDIELADSQLAGGEDHVVKTLFTLEEIGAQPRDLVSYHLWAEDLGPDGKPRRTTSDMFFAEVRYFEDIFRESENMGGGAPPPGGEQGDTTKLMKLQKDVMNATWKLIRRADMGRNFDDLGEDMQVVKESQAHAVGQAMEASERAEDPELKVLISTAADHMKEAVSILDEGIGKKNVESLRPVHAAERKAYESLVRARSREHDVTRSQQSQSAGQGQQQQQQLMQLEMKQKDLKYEEEREAMDPQQEAQQQAELEFLNRLQELARRQEAIAEKIKELENALEEANSEEEKQELERQLKRLQEEQEQLLRDLDELNEEMDTEENRANMAEERQKLEETREDVQEASEKLEEGKLADAANAATRAQRELEETKEEFRKKTSRRFDEEMRDLRRRARDLAENQETIGEKFEEGGQSGDSQNLFDENARSPLANAELAREIDQQRQELGEVLEEMRELSENAEESEPILSSALYDAVREARMGGIEESLEEARDLTRYDRRELAQESERAAARGLEDLKNDVEKAAEKVLGSEADALRLARSELEDLIEQSREETERLGGESGEEPPTDLAMNETDPNRQPGETQEGQAADPTGSDPTQQGKPGEPTGSGAESEAAATDGERQEARRRISLPKPGEKGEAGEGQEPGESEQPGQGKQPGEGKGQGQSEEQPKDQQLAERGQGQQPGKGQGEGESDQPSEQPGQGQGEGQPSDSEQMAEAGQGQGKGQQPGQGEGQGEGESQSQAQAQGEGQGLGQGEGQGQSPGEEQGQGQGEQPGERRGYRGGFAEAGQQRSPGGGSDSARSGAAGPNFGGGFDQRDGGVPSGSGDVDASQQPLFFQGAGEAPDPEGPITGRDYEEWSGRLRNLENMVEQDDLRNELAKVMDEARQMRIEFRRNNQPPQARAIDQRITMPLVEIRDRVAEELAKMDKENPLAPIDRDPVPREYRELVRRYYEELGSGR